MQNWIVDFVSSSGIWGIAVLMFLENIFPPIPSEIIMPLAGYLASRDDINFWGAVAAGTIGASAGATIWYGLGRALPEHKLEAWLDRRGIWIALQSEDVDRAQEFFRRHGRASVFIGRLLPVVRTLISVPAGYVRMPVGTFLLYTFSGTFLWTLVLTWVGYLLGSNFEQTQYVIGPASWAVLIAALIWYIYRVVRLHRKKRRDRDSPPTHIHPAHSAD